MLRRKGLGQTVESFLSTMPKSCVPEIQEIHTTMKDNIDRDFFVVYRSQLSQVTSKIKNKLSRGYSDLFEKIYQDFQLIPHNPFEHPINTIELQQQRIERAWKAVQTEISSIQKSLEYYRKLFLPIIDSDLKGDHNETIKCIMKIPYDTVGPYSYSSGLAGGLTITFPKGDFDKVLSSLIDKMIMYEEKLLLQDFIPIIIKVYDITRRTRKLEEDTWKVNNLKKGEYKHWKIHMHNSVGYINSGIGLNTHNSLKRIKLSYPDI